jgi:hypothetical protein
MNSLALMATVDGDDVVTIEKFPKK